MIVKLKKIIDMKKNIMICLPLGIALSLAGCSDFLEPEPKGKFTEDNFFTNQLDAINAVSGIYARILEEDGFVGGDELKYEGCADDVFINSDHDDIDPQVLYFTIRPDNAGLANRQWPVKYEVVSRANFVLLNVAKMSRDQITEEIQNRCLGEAYFLRAFAHWSLYLVHGEIPVMTVEDVEKNNYNKPKNTIDEVLGQIEYDLLQAAALLPATTPAAEGGRVHKGSAWAYLTQLYMHWSCFDGKDAYLDKAIEAGNHIVGNSDYAMRPGVDGFRECFTLRNAQINTEVLFQLNNGDGKGYGFEFGYFWQPRPWGGYEWCFPTQSLVDAFKSGGTDDPRFAATIMADGEVVTAHGGGSKIFVADDMYNPTGCNYFKKNSQFELSDDGESFDTDRGSVAVMMRSSDVYLLVAEAKIRKGQSGDVEINAVRNRVGAPTKTGYTAADLVLERRLELAAEGRRFFDLRRWDRKKFGGVDIVALTATFGPNNEPRTFQRPKHYFFPIPQDQIDKTNGVLKQNPAYL
ncbi:membrane protein [Bacteroidia bacterium]|nr:membrane protein [Bacteroidia bacterium]